jgi:hypothetical protein
MHTTLYRIPNIPRRSSRRTQILAAAGGLVAAGSIAVTLAVAGGGSTGTDTGAYPTPTGPSVHAHPDRATLYQRSVESPQPAGQIDGERAAERFHHFR